MNGNNILQSALLDLKLTLRSGVSFALILVMPILMVLMMGTVMKPTFDAVESGVEPFEVLYFNGDTGPIGAAFDAFLHSQQDGLVQLTETTVEDIEEGVLTGGYPAAILVPEDFSTQVTQNGHAAIQIIGSGKHLVEEHVVRAYVESFVLWTNTQQSLTAAAGLDPLAAANALQQAGIQYGTDFITEQVPQDPLFLRLTSFQFFSASMLVFFLLTTGMGIGSTLIDDRNNKTYKRIHSFPVQKQEYLLGKIISNGLLGIFQAFCIITVTRFAFGVHWGGQLAGISLIALLLIFISCAVGIIFSNIMRSSGAVVSSLTIIFWFMAFISGGFTGAPILESASIFTINYWAFEGIVTLMTGGVLRDILNSMIILLATAIILWSAGLLLYNRRVSYE